MANGKRVLVGMSGGVDSSLSVALLKEQGFEVTGVFMKVWSEGDLASLPWDASGCPWEQDLADARAVANQLGIELIIKNVQQAYWDRVVADFLAGYQAGRTPNPDVLCNSQVKFGLLYDWAMEQGYDYLATGHYARIEKNPPQSPFLKGEERTPLFRKEGLGEISSNVKCQMSNVALHRGIDPKKDQTYFLWQIDRKKLEHILFPIGHLTKVEVRKEAEKRGLATAKKKDSQGICFLGPLKVRQWLAETLETKPGEVLAVDGTVIGTHKGAHLYTLGQRQGFTVDGGGKRPGPFSTLRTPNSESDRPAHYVVKRDIKKNQLTVSPMPPRQRELLATNLNWLTVPPKSGDWVEARIRHGQQPQPALVSEITDRQFLIEFTDPQTGIAPGQSVVLSQGTVVLGGGIIA